MTGDYTILDQNSTTGRGGRRYNVAAGATAINAGEPVARALGATTVTAAATNTPVVGTDFFAGIATTNSTQTASIAGFVDVMPLSSGITYLVAPNVAASWTPQSAYDALVGKRVVQDLTTGTYTVDATDSANNGIIVQTLDIFKHPGKVAVAFRQAVSDVQ